MCAKNIRDSGTFGLVIGRRARAMGIDVTDSFFGQLCVLDRPGNRPGRPLFGRHHNIRGI